MQTSYSVNNPKAVAGLIYGAWDDMYIDSHFVAGEALEPGRLVILNGSNKLVHPQSTGFTDPVVGIVVFSPTNEQYNLPPTGYTYAAGIMVPVMRKGRIWAEAFSTAEPTQSFTALNVLHSSTTATNRGRFTSNATSAGAGVEVDTLPSVKYVETAVSTAAGATGLWLVELNLP